MQLIDTLAVRRLVKNVDEANIVDFKWNSANEIRSVLRALSVVPEGLGNNTPRLIKRRLDLIGTITVLLAYEYKCYAKQCLDDIKSARLALLTSLQQHVDEQGQDADKVYPAGYKENVLEVTYGLLGRKPVSVFSMCDTVDGSNVACLYQCFTKVPCRNGILPELWVITCVKKRKHNIDYGVSAMYSMLLPSSMMFSAQRGEPVERLIAKELTALGVKVYFDA